MSAYSIIHLIFLFDIYCFLGWCFESSYVSLMKKKAINRGFLQGPFLPLYGFGAMLLLAVTLPFRQQPILMFFVGIASASVLEYFTGAIMESTFKIKFWDYSQSKFNLNGHICLFSSIAWGFFTLFLVEFLHIYVNRFVYSVDYFFVKLIIVMVAILVIFDYILAWKTSLSLRNVIGFLQHYSKNRHMSLSELKAQLQSDKTKTELKRKLSSELSPDKMRILYNHPCHISHELIEISSTVKNDRSTSFF